MDSERIWGDKLEPASIATGNFRVVHSESILGACYQNIFESANYSGFFGVDDNSSNVPHPLHVPFIDVHYPTPTFVVGSPKVNPLPLPTVPVYVDNITSTRCNQREPFRQSRKCYLYRQCHFLAGREGFSSSSLARRGNASAASRIMHMNMSKSAVAVMIFPNTASWDHGSRSVACRNRSQNSSTVKPRASMKSGVR